MPIAKDIDETLLCIRKADGLLIGVEGAEVNEELGVTLAQYIEEIRDQLLMKKLVYEEELGLISIA